MKNSLPSTVATVWQAAEQHAIHCNQTVADQPNQPQHGQPQQDSGTGSETKTNTGIQPSTKISSTSSTSSASPSKSTGAQSPLPQPSPAEQLAHSAAQAQLLTFMTRVLHASSAISVGTDSTPEAMALAAGFNREGQLTVVDSSPHGADDARQHFDAAAYPGVSLRAVSTSPAEFLPRLNPNNYDIIVVSGDPANYEPTVKQAATLLRDNGFLLLTDMLNPNDHDKARITTDLLKQLENDDRFDTALTPTGTGLAIATLR